jgi:hypothetical protein
MSDAQFPTTENGISMLVNAEWHADQCKVNRTRKYMDCDCSLSRAIAAVESEAVSRSETVRRMQREGGGPVTAVMVSRADEVPEG